MAHKTTTLGRLTLDHVAIIAAIATGMATYSTEQAINESVKAIWGKYEFRHVVEMQEIVMLHSHAEHYKGTEAYVVLNYLHDTLVNLKRIEQILDR